MKKKGNVFISFAKLFLFAIKKDEEMSAIINLCHTSGVSPLVRM